MNSLLVSPWHPQENSEFHTCKHERLMGALPSSRPYAARQSALSTDDGAAAAYEPATVIKQHTLTTRPSISQAKRSHAERQGTPQQRCATLPAAIRSQSPKPPPARGLRRHEQAQESCMVHFSPDQAGRRQEPAGGMVWGRAPRPGGCCCQQQTPH